MAAIVGWLLLQAIWLAMNAQLEADAWVRKLEEELRLDKDMWLSTTRLASGLADNVGEQANKFETLACWFCKASRAQAAMD